VEHTVHVCREYVAPVVFTQLIRLLLVMHQKRLAREQGRAGQYTMRR
jgi:phosphate starvation-inducible membrane PsiE